MTSILIPPAEVRYRVVSQEHSEDAYLHIGRNSVESLRSMLDESGVSVPETAAVLDFGCGCARTIQPLHSELPQWKLSGTDTDRVSIEWATANVGYAEIAANDELPPLRYADDSFDLIYALSVFSHLPLAMQEAWLAELARIIRPGGLLYVTFNGTFVVEKVKLEGEMLDDFTADGFAYVANITDGVLPPWYQSSFQRPEFIESQLPTMRRVNWRSAGHGSWQDDLLMVKA